MQTLQPITKKPLPHAVTKIQLVAMYLDQMSEYTIREEIKTIILDNRKNTKCSTIKGWKVWHDELVEFVKIFGLPKGYYLPENY